VSTAVRKRAKRVTAHGQMAACLLRLAATRDPAAAPLARAVRTTLLGQVSTGEREWVERIEAGRGRLLADEGVTGPPFDPGSESPGGRHAMERRRTTVGVASAFVSLPPEWCLLLLRLVRELSPRSCLELGTGFGISTAYQAAALKLNGSGTMTTLEGSPAWAELAEASLSALGLERVTVRVGAIGETLPAELEQRGSFDFVFIDAEHQAGATLAYFDAMLPILSDGAVVVVDDVDWPAMKHSQAAIGSNERVSTSVSIGRLGVSVIGRPSPGSP
jgi:predicted O-methyltransferase YrrM